METRVKTAVPIPWDVMEGKTLLHIETRIDNPDGAGIAVCSLPKSAEATADFIVRAANCHAELLKALKALMYLTDQGREGGLILSRADGKPLTNADQDVIDRAYIAADNAREKAEGA